jgi:hypothetical protein
MLLLIGIASLRRGKRSAPSESMPAVGKLKAPGNQLSLHAPHAERKIPPRAPRGGIIFLGLKGSARSRFSLLQDLRAFFTNRLQAARVEVERIEDRRCDLGGVGDILDDLGALDARRGHHERHVAIVVGEAAMLGELAAAGADRPVPFLKYFSKLTAKASARGSKRHLAELRRMAAPRY